MKVIDLLNKIANGEEVPKKIKFCLRNFEFSKYKQDYFCRDNDEQGIYGMSICKWLFLPLLNDEVEIIEEGKKIKKVSSYVICDYDFKNKDEDNNLIATNIIDKAFEEYSHKINEIIDYLEENK